MHANCIVQCLYLQRGTLSTRNEWQEKKIALCLCTPPLNIIWRCGGEKISALTASSKKIAGLRKDMMMKNNDTTIVKMCVSGFSRAKLEEWAGQAITVGVVFHA